MIKMIMRIIAIMVLLLTAITIQVENYTGVNAAGREKIRVGYFYSDNYFYNQEGRLIGYDVEYLNKLAQYTNYDFEFVDCGTWFKGASMLEKHEIDLLGSSQWAPERDNTFAFCKESYGLSIGEIIVLPSNNICYEDYDSIAKMRIGCIKDYVYRNELLHKLALNNVYPQLVEYPSLKYLDEALQKGEVDGIATFSHLANQKFPVVEQYSYSPYYFISWAGNDQLVRTIDNALIRLSVDEPDFRGTMSKKYFPTLNQSTLTLEEKEYLASLGSLTFAFCTNEGYLCRTENGVYEGINPAIAKYICSKLGVEYKEVQVDFGELTSNLAKIKGNNDGGSKFKEEILNRGIDVWGDFYNDPNWARTMNVGLSQAYLNATYYQIKARGTVYDESTSKVAAVRGLRFTSEIVSKYAPEQMVWCDDFEDCIQAVESGKADVTYINTYAAEYYLSMYQYSNLSTILIEDTNQSSMAVLKDKNGLLISSINKVLRSITPEEMDQLINQETRKNPYQNPIFAFIHANVVLSIFITLVFVVLFVSWFLSMVNANKMKQKNQELLLATMAKNDFMARMSHDLRTPMNAIMNLLGNLTKELKHEPQVMEQIHQMKNSSEFLMSLLNDLLDVSRIEQGKMTLTRQIYHPSDFLAYLHTNFDEVCQQKQLEFIIDANIDYYSVYTDRARFNQLCFNIISNAVKYTPAGGKVTFRLDCKPLSDTYISADIYVEDTGIGMSEEFLQKAFNSFEQENRQFMSLEGAGLGLKIVSEITRLMHGTIDVKSQIHQGTTVHIRLPMELAERNVTEEKQALTPSEIEVLKNKLVLLVEDNELNQQIGKHVLQSKGMEVIIASDGQEAVEIYTEYSKDIQVILMDIRMPKVDGFEATRRIRNSNCENARAIPIIAVTANVYDGDIRECLLAGMNAYVPKPIDPNVLYRTMYELIPHEKDN